MKKYRYSLLLLICSLTLLSQTLPVFTVNTAGSNLITCKQPFTIRYAVTDYTAGPVTYSWVSANATYTGQMVKIYSPGTYTVSAFSGSSSYSTSISVQINTVAPSSNLAPLTQNINCGLSSVTTVTASSTVIQPTHAFLPPYGGSFFHQSSSLTYTPGGPGTYTHIVTDPNNGCTAKKTFTVTSASGFPKFSLVSAQNFSLGCGSLAAVTVTLDQASTVPPGNQISYTITQSSSYVTSAQNTFTFLLPGIMTAVVRDNSTACETQVRFKIYDNTIVTPPLVINLNKILSCRDKKNLIQITQEFPGNFAYHWIRPTGITHLYDSITVFPTSIATNSVNGTYSVVTTDLNNQCSLTQPFVVYQNLFPPKPIILSNGTSLTCQKDTLELFNFSTTTIPPGSFPTTFAVTGLEWIGPAPQASVTNANNYLVTVPGAYSVTVMDYNNGCASNTTILISDSRLLPPVSPSPVFDLCGQNSVVIFPLISGPPMPYAYLWHAPSNATTSVPTYSMLTTNAAGVYTLFVTNPSSSCTAVAQLTVGICVGIEKQDDPFPIRIYPNPFKHVLWIDSEAGLDITLSDATGRIILKWNLVKGKHELSLQEIPPGIYFLKEQKSTVPIKIIKAEE